MPVPQTTEKILLFPQIASNPWIAAYCHIELSRKNEATIDAYLRMLRQITEWTAHEM